MREKVPCAVLLLSLYILTFAIIITKAEATTVNNKAITTSAEVHQEEEEDEAKTTNNQSIIELISLNWRRFKEYLQNQIYENNQQSEQNELVREYQQSSSESKAATENDNHIHKILTRGTTKTIDKGNHDHHSKEHNHETKAHPIEKKRSIVLLTPNENFILQVNPFQYTYFQLNLKDYVDLLPTAPKNNYTLLIYSSSFSGDYTAYFGYNSPPDYYGSYEFSIAGGGGFAESFSMSPTWETFYITIEGTYGTFYSQAILLRDPSPAILSLLVLPIIETAKQVNSYPSDFFEINEWMVIELDDGVPFHFDTNKEYPIFFSFDAKAGSGTEIEYSIYVRHGSGSFYVSTSDRYPQKGGQLGYQANINESNARDLYTKYYISQNTTFYHSFFASTSYLSATITIWLASSMNADRVITPPPYPSPSSTISTSRTPSRTPSISISMTSNLSPSLTPSPSITPSLSSSMTSSASLSSSSSLTTSTSPSTSISPSMSSSATTSRSPSPSYNYIPEISTTKSIISQLSDSPYALWMVENSNYEICAASTYSTYFKLFVPATSPFKWLQLSISARSGVKVLISVGKRPNVFADNIIWTWNTKHNNIDNGHDDESLSYSNSTTHHHEERGYTDRWEHFYIPSSSPTFSSGIYFLAVQTTGLVWEKPQCFTINFGLSNWLPRKI